MKSAFLRLIERTLPFEDFDEIVNNLVNKENHIEIKKLELYSKLWASSDDPGTD